MIAIILILILFPVLYNPNDINALDSVITYAKPNYLNQNNSASSAIPFYLDNLNTQASSSKQISPTEPPKQITNNKNSATFKLASANIPKGNTPGPSSAYDNMIEKYAKEYGIDPGKMKRIAKCESHFNPLARNGIYGGMYQYSPATWKSTRKSMGLDPNPDLRFNPEEAIKTTAFKIANGGIRAWPVCGKR